MFDDNLPFVAHSNVTIRGHFCTLDTAEFAFNDKGKNRVNLLYVLEHYRPHVGGMETLFGTLCEVMSARGHRVTVITWRTSPDAPSREVLNGVTVIRVRSFGRYAFPFAGLAATIRAAQSADVIHTATFGAAPLAWITSRFARRLGRPPVIITVPETWIGRWRTYTDFGLLRAAVHELLERLILLFAYDRYVGISQSTTSRLKSVLCRRELKIATIYCGFDPAAWSNEAIPSSRQSFGIHSDAYLIVAWGRPGTSKGFTYLVDAFPAILSAVPSARLLLILNDAPEYRKAREGLVLRANSSVTIVDSLPFKSLVAIVRNADCAVVPSLAEGFGYTTLEAVAAGIPVAASNSTSIPEVIGGRHRLFNPGDIGALAAAVIAIAAGDYETTPARSFPWKDTADAYEKLYRETLQRRN